MKASGLPSWLKLTLILLLLLLAAVIWLSAGKLHDTAPVAQTVPGAPVSPPVFEEKVYQPYIEPAEVVPERVKPKPVKPEAGVVLVMDDVGYDIPALKRVLALPFPVAIAIIPNAPYAKKAAELAHEAGQVVMLHVPMEPANPKYRAKMDEAFLRADMDQAQVVSRFAAMLDEIPFVQGVNNHMGSYLTTLDAPMRWVMQACAEHGLFFIDSKTAAKSVASEVAAEYGLRWGERRIFLDHQVDADSLKKAWKKARECAAHGVGCIVIAHPHPETLNFLEHYVDKQDDSMFHTVETVLHAGKSST